MTLRVPKAELTPEVSAGLISQLGAGCGEERGKASVGPGRVARLTNGGAVS